MYIWGLLFSILYCCVPSHWNCERRSEAEANKWALQERRILSELVKSGITWIRVYSTNCWRLACSLSWLTAKNLAQASFWRRLCREKHALYPAASVYLGILVQHLNQDWWRKCNSNEPKTIGFAGTFIFKIYMRQEGCNSELTRDDGYMNFLHKSFPSHQQSAL